MLILLIILVLVITIVLVCTNEADSEEIFFGGLVIEGILGIILFLVMIFYPYNIGQKIEMYTEENQNIETKVRETVRAYMNYEQETYQALVESADLQTLIIKYPELNSNELVRMEIETYKENNNKIRELKESEIDKRVIGFWYFFNIGVK